jgi:anhydro-N-acetylmuramic acid kinase
MPERLIIGVMSGTSVDAIDAALVKIDGRAGAYRIRVLHHLEHRWPARLFSRLHSVMAPAQTTTQEICLLNFLVAREFAVAVEKILVHSRISRNRITALASHGQTVCHLPRGKAGGGATLQLGDVSVLAALTGIPTVGNFRTADMAAGGQGAPLVPFADAILLSHPTKARCIQNIGGIANVTYLPAGKPGPGSFPRVIAFDTGPGNMLLDAIAFQSTRGARRFDKNGRLAAAGRLDSRLLRRLQRHPYFSRKPPKSTGREDFGIVSATRLYLSIQKQKSSVKGWDNDLLHTATRLTAWSIADAYRRFLPRMPDEVILCGGGADNPVLVGMLQEELRGVRLRRIDALGIPNKAKEAASFAVLGAATLDGVPGNVMAVTGAARPVILGEIADPRIKV